MLSRGQLAFRTAVSVLRHAKNSLFLHTNMETTVPFGRTISVRQLRFAVLSDKVFWNRCIRQSYQAPLRIEAVWFVTLVSVYCSTIRSVLEYASHVWAALPAYLNDLLEHVLRKALHIVFPDRCYSDALYLADLELHSDRRQQACVNFAMNCHVSGTLSSLFQVPMIYHHGCNLRSGSRRAMPLLAIDLMILWLSNFKMCFVAAPCNSVVSAIGLNKRLID